MAPSYATTPFTITNMWGVVLAPQALPTTPTQSSSTG
jgi:hypothetical protein